MLGFQLLLYTDVVTVKDTYCWCALQQKSSVLSCAGQIGLSEREIREICKFLKFGTSAFLSLLGEVS